MGKLLRSAFDIRPGEMARVGLMFLLYMIIVASGFVVGRTVSASLFLHRLELRFLPYALAAAAAAVCLASAAYTRLPPRLRGNRVFMLTLALFAATMLVLRALLGAAPDSLAVVGAVYVLVDAFAVLCVTQFWTLACEVFTTREARRLFGLVGAGSTVAMLAFGGLTNATVRLTGAPNLLYLMAILLVAGVGLLAAVDRGQKRREAAEGPSHDRHHRSERGDGKTGFFSDLHRLFSTSNLAVAAGITMVMAAVITIVDFQWKTSAREAYGADENALAGYFGLFNVFVGLAALFFQLFITGRVLGHLGVLPALTILPLALVGGSAGILVASATAVTLFAGTAAAAANSLFRFTIQTASVQLLFRPVPAWFRPRAEALVEGVLKPATTIAAGLAIAAVSGILPPRDLSFAAIAFLAVWLLLNLAARRNYLKALGERISSRRLDLESSSLPLDASTIAVIRKALMGSDERETANALELIRSQPGEHDWCAEVAFLLDSPNRRVRHLALQYLEERGGPHYLAPRSRLKDSDPEVRGAAARAVGAVLREQCTEELLPVMSDPDPGVRAAAAATIVRQCSPSHSSQALTLLDGMSVSEERVDRLAAACALGWSGGRLSASASLSLLADEDESVRAQAAASVCDFSNEAVLKSIVGLLGSAATFRPASAALVKAGEEALLILAQRVQDHTVPFPVRLRIPRILGEIGSPRCLSILVEAMRAAEVPLRRALSAQAARLSSRNTDSTLDTAAVRELLNREVRCFFEMAVARADLSPPAGSLLAEAFEWVQLNCRLCILNLLAAENPSGRFALVEHGMSSRSAGVQADAIELLDYSLDGSDRSRLMALFESAGPEAAARAGRQLFSDLVPMSTVERLAMLAGGNDRWLAACVLQHAGAARVRSMVPTARLMLSSSNPFMAQTALGALRDLLDSTEFMSLVRTLRNDQRPLVASCASKAAAGGTMVTIVERVLFLKSVDLFSQIPGNVLSRIAEITREEQIPEGSVVLRQGDPGTGLYVVMKGSLQLLVDGNEVARLGEKQFFGEMSLFDSEPVSATVTALTDVDLLRLEPHDFSDLMAERVEVAHGLIAVLIRRLRTALRPQ